MDTTLIKGLRVFEYLVNAAEPQGVTALASALKLQKSNVHRTLAALLESGYVEQNSLGSYRPTLRTWEMGMKVMGRNTIRCAAQSFMQGLHREFGETVNLAVLEGAECLFIHQIMSPVPIRPTSDVGCRAPAVYMAAGQVLLAYQPEKRVRSIWERQTRQYKDKPRLSWSTLLAALKSARATGCAYCIGDWREGISSVACAIVGPDEVPVASIAVSGPDERMTKQRLKVVARELLNACTQVGQVLGGT